MSQVNHLNASILSILYAGVTFATLKCVSRIQ